MHFLDCFFVGLFSFRIDVSAVFFSLIVVSLTFEGSSCLKPNVLIDYIR